MTPQQTPVTFLTRTVSQNISRAFQETSAAISIDLGIRKMFIKLSSDENNQKGCVPNVFNHPQLNEECLTSESPEKERLATKAEWLDLQRALLYLALNTESKSEQVECISQYHFMHHEFELNPHIGAIVCKKRSLTSIRRDTKRPRVQASARTGLQPISVPIPVISSSEVVSQQSYRGTLPKKSREECLKSYKEFRFTRAKEIIIRSTELPALKKEVTRLMEDLQLLLDHYEKPTTLLGQSFVRRLKRCKEVLSHQEETQKEPLEGRKDKTRPSPESDNEVAAMAHILNLIANRVGQQNSQHQNQANQEEEESDDGDLMIDDREEDDECFPLKKIFPEKK